MNDYKWTAAKLVIIVSVFLLLQNVFPSITRELSLKQAEFLYQPWTFLTYIFLHGSFTHFFSNMLSLFIFGSILEKVVGHRNFLGLFLLTGVFSGISSVFVYNSVIGASGSVFGIMGALAMLRPKMTVWAIGVPMPMMAAIVFYALLDLAGAFYPSNIAHVGHLSALAVGIVLGLILRNRYALVGKKRERIEISEEEFRRWEDFYMRRKPKKEVKS